MQKRCGVFVSLLVIIGPAASALFAQTPVLEDPLTDASRITGQRGSGVFSIDGYTLTRSVSDCEQTGNPRSGDFVYYDLNKSMAGGSWSQGSIEWDITGLASQACPAWNELLAACDCYNISPHPAWDNGSFYESPYFLKQRKLNEPLSQHIDKMKPTATCISSGLEKRTDILSWNASTIYRFRITWSGTQMRWYRGTPGQSLTHLVPPSPFYFEGGCNWNPEILHIQLGSTFRAYRTHYSGGVPGSRYSLIRVYNTDIGNAATPAGSWPTGVTIDMGTTDDEDGLNRVVSGDGDTVPVDIGGREARRNVDPNQDYYIYFNVDNGFAYQGSKPQLFVMIDYYDSGSGSLALQYDAAGNIYKDGGGVILGNSNTWKQHMYYITDAYFGNRQNGGADFRIFGGAGNTFYLDVVGVSEQSPLPAQAGNPSPPDQDIDISIDADLSWAPAQGANSYDVYFGTDETAVTNAHTGSPEFQGNQSETTFDLPTLSTTDDYYWRIDTVNGFGTTKGEVWSFTTGPYPGDFDRDDDIDLEDFGYFQACYSGPGMNYPPGCEVGDFNSDNDVDQEDFIEFRACMGGAGRPPDC